VFAFVFWVIGDTLTTYYGLRVFGLKEQNFFVAFTIKRWGIKGFIFIKIVVFTLICSLSLAVYFFQWPMTYSSLMICIPLIFGGIGILTTMFNLSVILDKYCEKRKLHTHE
jgi:hypothetical protein